MILTNNKIILEDYNIYIFGILIFVSIITLILNKSSKFRIIIASILFVILKMIFNFEISGYDYILLFLSVFVIPEFNSTPNTAFIQIIFGLIIGLISIFLSLQILFIVIILFIIIFKYIYKNYRYFLAK